MNGVNFEKLVALVRPNLEKQDPNLRKSIPIEKRVGAALWRLASGNSFRSVAKTLAIGKSSSVKITRFLRRNCSDIFKSYKISPSDCNCKIPQTVGAIDGTHIFIQTQENQRKFDYYCRKQRYSINTQVNVDSNLMFLNVSTGFPGSTHDSRAFKNSPLFHEAEERNIRPNPTTKSKLALFYQEMRDILLTSG